MADIDIGRAPANSIVLPFFGMGALFYLTLSILLLFSGGDWNGHYFTPHLLAIVHTAVLGWGSMVIFGASYQILPVICERDLFSPRLASISFICLTAGVFFLAPSFWWFIPGWTMITGGALVVAAAVLYSINAYYTTRTCKRYFTQRLFILSSACWLLLTTTAGLLLAINFGHPFIFRNHLDLLKLHAHAGLAGWFLQLITGVSTKLVPMFVLGRSSKMHWLHISFGAQNTGLVLFIIDGLIEGPSYRSLLYAGLIALGVVAWLVWLADCFKNRARKAFDWPMRQVFVSFPFLLLAFLFIPLVYYNARPKWALVYGLFLLLGWLTSIILGMTFKTLPFIVWNGRYKNLNGKIKIPMPKHLYNERWVRYQFITHLSALLLLIPGILLQQPLLIRLALGIGLITAILYTSNAFKVIFHRLQ
ncbi:MAG TPA: hypothetical protein VHD83_15230 [Puia sp.]|nr:hypothetical protein [Puia sp.]